jgi:hypothetical protein
MNGTKWDVRVLDIAGLLMVGSTWLSTRPAQRSA